MKELIWTFQRKDPLFNTEFLSISQHNGKCRILFNGIERIHYHNMFYFTRYQPNKYHTGRGGVISPDSIFVYSFSLFPEKYEPSGVCNFSVIDNVELEIINLRLALDPTEDINDGLNLIVYGVNYNIMEIRDGQVDVLFKPTL